MLARFCNWFDGLKEPNRFFTFVVIVFGCYIPFTVAMFVSDATTGHQYYFFKVLLVVLGVIQLFFLIVLALYRALRK